MRADGVSQFMTGSKVVDATGRPRAVYHGTMKNFSTFKTPAWFSTDKYESLMYATEPSVKPRSGRLIRAYLNIKNPYKAEYLEELFNDPVEDKKWLRSRILEGYDGVVGQPWAGRRTLYWIAFYPKQILIVGVEDGLSVAAEGILKGKK